MISLQKLSGILGRFQPVESKPPALAPGTLVYVGEERAGPVGIRIMDFSEDTCEEKSLENCEEALSYRDRKTTTWIDLDGVHDTAIIQKIGDHYAVHPLVLEDIVHTHQRPKIEEHQGLLYLVLKMLTVNDETQAVEQEQVSFIVGKNFLISFQQKPGDVFDPVRERIKTTRWRTRKLGADYLVYALLDAIVDHYFLVLERLGGMADNLEERAAEGKDSAVLSEVYRLKRELLLVRKVVWPLREVMSSLIREDYELLGEPVRPYLRDVSDHTVQIAEMTDSLRDMLSGMHDLYLSMVSNRMNEVMKVLTIIATLFIPPTFIAGIYGMNFDFMPELHWKPAYFFALGLMALSIFSMLFYFRKKKWF